jgi:hypothetical protein
MQEPPCSPLEVAIAEHHTEEGEDEGDGAAASEPAPRTRRGFEASGCRSQRNGKKRWNRKKSKHMRKKDQTMEIPCTNLKH